MTHVFENGASFLVRRNASTDNKTAQSGDVLNAMHTSALDSFPSSTQNGIDNHTRVADEVQAEYVPSLPNADEISPEANPSTREDDWHHRTSQVCGLC